MSTAIVTGASRGLGLALAEGLVQDGWSLVIDGRDASALAAAAAHLIGTAAAGAAVQPVPGDITDASHRRRLIEAARAVGGVELVVNNASTLGPSPLPPLTNYPLDGLRYALETNVVAPLALIQAAAPLLATARRPRILNITSDASVESYPGWGGYGSSKAALDQVSAVLAIEQTGWRVWVVDPGDLRTRMHQKAFPGEDISDRPEPASVVPALVALIDSEQPSGRLRVADLAVTGSGR
jgi:NAD(P)-dependent dehydrogenase (short-subunit alcohol dehydrogenase family)